MAGVMDIQLILSVITGVSILLVLILRLKFPAFISLLISAITIGLLSGMSPKDIIDTIQTGMGGTLGFVAVVVGLGAIFGSILEHSGGAQALAQYLLSKFGLDHAPWAVMLAGFFIAIPVFFDVAFIILIPIIYAIQRRSGKSLLLYAIPLLAGLAITHSFIPPTPGPVAVADIVGAQLGWVILFGFIVGIPTAVICGPIFGKYIAAKIDIQAPFDIQNIAKDYTDLPPITLILISILIPIVLILLNTLLGSPLIDSSELWPWVIPTFTFIGHPFVALIIANMIVWYALGIRRGYTKSQLLDISTSSLKPAGIIILLTGAGGVLKQMLVDTGSGEMLANILLDAGIPVLVFAFMAASIIRVLQGSATVAMITAAGLIVPLLSDATSEISKAILVIAIASGASIFSHVNDSGFWLVGKYLGISEKDTFRSWSVMTTILALSGFSMCLLLELVF